MITQKHTQTHRLIELSSVHHNQKTKASPRMLTTLPVGEDLSYTAGLISLCLPHGTLGHLVRRAGELNVELLLTDGLP